MRQAGLERHAGKAGMSQARSFGVLILATGMVLLQGATSQAQLVSQGGHSILRMVGISGKSSQGYLGVDLSDISDDQVSALKLTAAHGAEIIGLDHDAPGCKAGLQVHDVILQMNGQAIENQEQLRRMLRETPAGRQVSLLVSRDGQQRTVQIQLANREDVEREAWENHYTVPEPSGNSSIFSLHGATSFLSPSKSPLTKGTHNLLGSTNMLVSSSYTGAKLEVMGPQLAEFFGAQGSGLLVRSVDPSSPAAEAGLRAGDVVVKVNDAQVASASEWSKVVHDNRGKSLSLVVLRDRKERTVTLTPDGKKRSSVEPWSNLESFFGNSEQAQETRATLAEFEPMFAAMSARMRQQLEEVRETPEMMQMMARLDAVSGDPEFRRQMEMAHRQLSAAADAMRQRVDSPELRQKMDLLHEQMRNMMRLD